MNCILNGQDLNLVISRRYRYAPEQPTIEAFCKDGEPYAVVSVCLPNIELGQDETILDTNNIPSALNDLVNAGLVEDVGMNVWLWLLQVSNRKSIGRNSIVRKS